NGAGFFVEGGERAGIAPGGADEQIAVNERGFAIAPVDSASVHRHALQVLEHVLAPDFLALAGDIDADKIPLSAESVKAIAVDGGRSARAVAPLVALEGENRADRSGPELLAGFLVEGDDDLVL